MSVAVLQRFVSNSLALAFAVLAAVATFFAPIIVYGSDDILLAWGWIAPFVALPIALLVGSAVRAGLLRAMPGGASAASSHRFTIVAATSAALAAASAYLMLTYGDRNLSWSEQLTLRDGSTLVVQRSVIGSAFGRSQRRAQDWLPSAFGIDVSSGVTFAGAQVWRSSLRPVLLDKLDNGSLVIVAEPKEGSRRVIRTATGYC